MVTGTDASNLSNQCQSIIPATTTPLQIPTEYGLMTGASWASWYLNSLTGSVPTQLGQLREHLSVGFHLSLNTLTGTIPSQLGMLSSRDMAEFTFYHNEFSSIIPVSF